LILDQPLLYIDLENQEAYFFFLAAFLAFFFAFFAIALCVLVKHKFKTQIKITHGFEFTK